MRKYYFTAILSLLMATSSVFTSCGEDDITEEIENPTSELKVWIEPYNVKGASIEDVMNYMGKNMSRYSLKTENNTADIIQLAYSTGNGNEGILYSFSRTDNTLYSVIDTELTYNSSLIMDYLHKHYTLIGITSEASLQYCFTTEDRSMVITTMKVSDTYFNVNYTWAY